jgi:hypothetical protein
MQRREELIGRGAPRHPINPVEKSGLVVLNGQVHNALANMARDSLLPLYARALGVEYDNFYKVQRLDIVYTIINKEASINALAYEGLESATDRVNNKVFAIAALNGQGEGEVDRWNMMTKMEVWGFAEEDSDQSGLFNILAKGQHTVYNSGTQTINTRDTVIAWMPSPEEVADSDNPNGVAKLVTMPFDSERHSVTPKPIYKCLRDMRASSAQDDGDDDTYLPAYKRMCTNFYQSIKDMALVAMNAGADKLMAVARSPKATRMDLVQTMNEYMNADDQKYDDVFREQLFVMYAESKRYIESMARPGDSELNVMQAEAVGRFMMSCAEMCAIVEKMKLGTAVTTALPGQFFTILQK